MWYKLTCCFYLDLIIYFSVLWVLLSEPQHRNTWVTQKSDLVSVLKVVNWGSTEFSTSIAKFFFLTTLLPKFSFKVSHRACFPMEPFFSQEDKWSIEYNCIMLILLHWLPNRSSVGERFNAVLKCSTSPAYQVDVCIILFFVHSHFLRLGGQKG